MGKIAFTARKDPLLRDPAKVPPAPRRAGVDTPPVDALVADRVPAAKPELEVHLPNAPRVHEEPRGVVAVSSVPSVPAPRPAPGSPADVGRYRDPAGPVFDVRVPLRVSRRRVQTSMSLPPELWVELERLAHGAGLTPGEVLHAVLRKGFPDSPEAALASLERVLDRMPVDEGLLEERNYRLSLEVREGLDRLSKMLSVGPRSRMHRSLLIRAILLDQMLATPVEARELVNGLRVQDMRESLRAANEAESASVD